MVCRLICESSTAFKIFATADSKIFRHATPMGPPQKGLKIESPGAVAIEQKCPKCNNVHKIYAKFVKDSNIDNDFKKKGFKPFPKDVKIKCNCGFEIDLLGIKNKIEMETGRKIII